MKIEWFPGHMTKALRMMQTELQLADVVFYVLDARAPLSSLNPALSKMFSNKPFVYILNKADLADEKTTKLWEEHFNKIGKAVSLNGVKSNSAKVLSKIALELTKEKQQKNLLKGIAKPIRAMIVGIPNSGKSTIVNNLCGRGATITGNKPGVTKGKQWVRVSPKFEVLDTPGTLWPTFEKEEIGENLALIGSINENIVDQTELAGCLIKKVEEKFLVERYGAIKLDEIAKKRGYLISGGKTDIDRTAKAIIDEFKNGKLGRISLEVPKI